MLEEIAPARRLRKDRQRNLERVLAAARELFALHGPDVRVEDVARRAGVGVATIYRCFPSKQQLFDEISQAACTSTRSYLMAASQEASDPVVRLRALITAQYREGAQQSALIDPHPASDQAWPACDSVGVYDTLRILVTRILVDGQRAGLFRDGDPALLAAMVVELLTTRTLRRLQLQTGTSVEALAEQVTAFVLDGVVAGHATRDSGQSDASDAPAGR